MLFGNGIPVYLFIMNGSKTGAGTKEGALYFCGVSFSAAVGRQSERQTLFRLGRLTFDQDFLRSTQEWLVLVVHGLICLGLYPAFFAPSGDRYQQITT